jgi:dTDP-4-dehydrorhamnose 3,5-epimerase
MTINVTPTEIPEVLLLESRIFADERGLFLESWNAREFNAVVGSEVRFVQDNHSRSGFHVLRGMHYQIQRPQGKLIRIVYGSIFDVAVDLRRSSRTFKCWVGIELNDSRLQQLWIPPGFAHGFMVLSERADVIYKTTDVYAPEHERCLLWNDLEIGINWPLEGDPVMSAKDRSGLPLSRLDLFS